MFSILSFPDFGCGGMFCTMFNQQKLEWSDTYLHTVKNEEHDALKIGANYINGWSYDKNDWHKAILSCQKNSKGKFCGTHIPLANLSLPKSVNNLVQICTETISSRLILWLRAHKLIFQPKHSIHNVIKQREFAKDFTNLIVRPYKGAINIELSNYLYDKNYRNHIHNTFDLHFDEHFFLQWKTVNRYVFNLNKSNIAVQVFLDNVTNSS